jgi:hypothetical protein
MSSFDLETTMTSKQRKQITYHQNKKNSAISAKALITERAEAVQRQSVIDSKLRSAAKVGKNKKKGNDKKALTERDIFMAGLAIQDKIDVELRKAEKTMKRNKRQLLLEAEKFEAVGVVVQIAKTQEFVVQRILDINTQHDTCYCGGSSADIAPSSSSIPPSSTPNSPFFLSLNSERLFTVGDSSEMSKHRTDSEPIDLHNLNTWEPATYLPTFLLPPAAAMSSENLAFWGHP